MDVTSMPYESSTFDAVIDKSLIDCLQCCTRSADILRSYLDEVCRVLAPGGVFVAISCHTARVLKAVLRGRAWNIIKIEEMKLVDGEKANGNAHDSVTTLSICVNGVCAEADVVSKTA